MTCGLAISVTDHYTNRPVLFYILLVEQNRGTDLCSFTKNILTEKLINILCDPVIEPESTRSHANISVNKCHAANEP